MATVKQKIQDCLQRDVPREALPHAATLCRVFPKNHESWRLSALVHLRIGELTKAESLCRKGLRIKPNDSDLHQLLGEIMAAKNDSEAAIQCYKLAIQLDANNCEANYHLAVQLASSNQLQAADECLERATFLNPGHGKAWFLRGAVYGKLNEFTKSVYYSQMSLAIDPEDIDTNYNLAQAYRGLGHLHSAVEYYLKVISLNPNHFNALSNLGVTLQELGRLEEARVYYNKALLIDSEAENIRYSLASLDGVQPPPEYVAKLFDDNAEIFEELLVKHLRYVVPELLNDLLRRCVNADVLKSLDVLDVGCGTGLCAPLLKDITRKLTGIDLSENMVSKAKEKNLYDELLVGDAEEFLRNHNNCYDLIIAADVMMYIGNLTDIISASFSNLKPGGYLLFSAEDSETDDLYMDPKTLRYSHAVGSVRKLAGHQGFEECGVEGCVLRVNSGKPVNGHLYLYRKP